ncbi:MAG: DUF1674 domain-containing protein [Rickettsiales bacterium]|nr:DUF1674 domain-containing protein [Rickettsiales bacterium]
MSQTPTDSTTPAKSQTTDDDTAIELAESSLGATKEHGGPKGLEPTRYGDWERNGRCTDF